MAAYTDVEYAKLPLRERVALIRDTPPPPTVDQIRVIAAEWADTH